MKAVARSLAGARRRAQARQGLAASIRAERGCEHRGRRACKGPRRLPSRPKQAPQDLNLQPRHMAPRIVLPNSLRTPAQTVGTVRKPLRM